MLAGQTAVPKWLKLFEKTHGTPGLTKAKQFHILFFQIKLFSLSVSKILLATPSTSAT